MKNEIRIPFLILYKIVLFLLFVLALTLPINTPLSFVFLIFFSVILFLAKAKKNKRKFDFLLYLPLLLLVILNISNLIFPKVEIQEGHNVYFLPEEVGNPEYSELPEIIRKKLQEEFLIMYPKKSWTPKDTVRGWRSSFVPNSTWAFSLDAIWDNFFGRVKYSRIVQSINFSSSLEFRGGFVNNTQSNSLGRFDFKEAPKNPDRNNMPFFVMYEISHSMVGGLLKYSGSVFSEDKNKNIYTHDSRGTISIQKGMVGNKFYALSVNYEQNPLSIEFIPSPSFKLYSTIKIILLCLALISLLCAFSYHWHDLKKNIFVTFCPFAAFAFIVDYFFYKESIYSFFYDSVIRWGLDGLIYKGFARVMAMEFSNFNFYETLRGTVDVFYFMPGYRYIRFFESLIFGETDIGRIFIWIFFLFSIYKFFLTFFNKNIANFFFLIMVCGFPGLAHFYFDMNYYFLILYRGEAETFAYAFFIFGQLSLVEFFQETKSKRKNKEENQSEIWQLFVANFFLGMSVFIRPNLSIAVFFSFLITVLLFCSKSNLKYSLIIFLGFFPAICPLLHNLIYGKKFVIFTETDVHFTYYKDLTMGITSYLKLFILDKESYIKLFEHLSRWSGGITRPLMLLIMVVLLYTSLFKEDTQHKNRIFYLFWGSSVLGLHIPLFIFFADGRYSSLAWLVTFSLFLHLLWEKFFKRLKFFQSPIFIS